MRSNKNMIISLHSACTNVTKMTFLSQWHLICITQIEHATCTCNAFVMWFKKLYKLQRIKQVSIYIYKPIYTYVWKLQALEEINLSSTGFLWNALQNHFVSKLWCHLYNEPHVLPVCLFPYVYLCICVGVCVRMLGECFCVCWCAWFMCVYVYRWVCEFVYLSTRAHGWVYLP